MNTATPDSYPYSPTLAPPDALPIYRASVVSIGERPRNTLRPLPLRAVDPRTGRHARLTGRVRLAVPETVVNFRLHAIRVPAQLVSDRSEEHTSELQSLMRISYAVFCLKKKQTTTTLLCYNAY